VKRQLANAARPGYSAPVNARSAHDPEKGGPARSGSALATRLSRSPQRLSLAELPTPVDRAPWLDTSKAKVWIKRDDLSSPIYGGGKVRKLEWILANAPFDTDLPILSVGGVGSHHLLALALFLRTQGRTLHGLTFTQALTPHVRKNLAVLLSCGAQLWNVSSRAELPRAWLAYHLWRRPDVKGTSMSAGASTPLGCFGFVDAAFELAAQVEAGLLPKPDVVYVTAGSAGTSAGLALGFALAGMPVHMHLVSSVEPWAFNTMMMQLKMRGALSALRQAGLDAPAGVRSLLRDAGVTYEIDFDEVGAGYGEPTEGGLAAVDFAREHDISLEPTYTAKCISALRRTEAHDRGRPRNVLFWHTHAANDLSAHIEPGWEAKSPVLLDDAL
jgi:D-cysteine desulfhydrase